MRQRRRANAEVVLGAYALEEVLRGNPKTARNLRDRRDPEVPLASLGAGKLNWMYPAAMGESLLGEFLTVAEALDVAANQNLGLGHLKDVWALSQ